MNIRILFALVLVVGASACSSQKVVSSDQQPTVNAPVSSSSQNTQSPLIKDNSTQEATFRQAAPAKPANPVR